MSVEQPSDMFAGSMGVASGGGRSADVREQPAPDVPAGRVVPHVVGERRPEEPDHDRRPRNRLVDTAPRLQQARRHPVQHDRIGRDDQAPEMQQRRSCRPARKQIVSPLPATSRAGARRSGRAERSGKAESSTRSDRSGRGTRTLRGAGAGPHQAIRERRSIATGSSFAEMVEAQHPRGGRRRRRPPSVVAVDLNSTLVEQVQVLPHGEAAPGEQRARLVDRLW